MRKSQPLILLAGVLGLGLAGFFLWDSLIGSDPREGVPPKDPQPLAHNQTAHQSQDAKPASGNTAKSASPEEPTPDDAPAIEPTGEVAAEPKAPEPIKAQVPLDALLELHRKAFASGDFAACDEYAKSLQVYAPLSAQPLFEAELRNEDDFLRKRMLLEMLHHDKDGALIWRLLSETQSSYRKFVVPEAVWLEGESIWLETLLLRGIPNASEERGGVASVENLLKIVGATPLRGMVFTAIALVAPEQRQDFLPILRREVASNGAAAQIAAETLLRALPDQAQRLALLDDPNLRPHLGMLLNIAISEKLVTKEEAVTRVTTLLTANPPLPEAAMVLDVFGQSFPQESLTIARELLGNPNADSGLRSAALVVMARDGQANDRETLLALALGKAEFALAAVHALVSAKCVDQARVLFTTSDDATIKSLALPALVEVEREKYLDLALEANQDAAVRRAATELLRPSDANERKRLENLGVVDTSATVRLAALRKLYEARDSSTFGYFEQRALNESDPAVRAQANAMAGQLKKLLNAGK